MVGSGGSYSRVGDVFLNLVMIHKYFINYLIYIQR